MTDRAILFFCGDLHNLGDLALLLQNLETKPPARQAYVRRWLPLPEDIVQQVEAAGGTLVNGRNFRTLIPLAFRSDIVIGGGQLVRENLSLASLASQLAACLAARAGGGRILTRGLGVSRIRRRAVRILWQRLLRLAPAVLVRDEASADNAAGLVGAARVRLTADMAFLPSSLHAHAAVDAPVGARHVLIVPCIDPGEGRTFDGPNVPALIEAIRAALPASGLAFACHDPRPTMDRRAVDDLVARHRLVGREPTHGYSLRKLLEDYHAAALVVTNRLHSIIFSLLAGRPVLIVDDGNTKTAAIAKRFGIPSVSVVRPDAYASAVNAALDFDRDLRGRALETVASASQANLGND